MAQMILSGSFDDLRARHMRLLQEARRLGELHVLLWSDQTVRAMEGADPKFPEQERKYFVESIRYVDHVDLVDFAARDGLPAAFAARKAIWVVEEAQASSGKAAFCRDYGLHYQLISEEQLAGFPMPEEVADKGGATPNKKVVVTGCFDWFHSGHVRFFEEVSELGDLYAVVGNDATIKLLKGEGHPLHSQDERRYMAGSIRFVKRAMISSGTGWLDAEPEIEQIKPDMYVVNEDGDRPEKRDYCEAHAIEYRVLKRTPKEGLPKRESTTLRGF